GEPGETEGGGGASWGGGGEGDADPPSVPDGTTPITEEQARSHYLEYLQSQTARLQYGYGTGRTLSFREFLRGRPGWTIVTPNGQVDLNWVTDPAVLRRLLRERLFASLGREIQAARRAYNASGLDAAERNRRGRQLDLLLDLEWSLNGMS